MFSNCVSYFNRCNAADVARTLLAYDDNLSEIIGDPAPNVMWTIMWLEKIGHSCLSESLCAVLQRNKYVYFLNFYFQHKK